MFRNIAAAGAALIAVIMGSGAISLLGTGEAGYGRLLGLILALGTIVLLILALKWFNGDS